MTKLEHRTTVETPRMGAYRAECRCGWQGAPRATIAAAQADGGLHTASKRWAKMGLLR